MRLPWLPRDGRYALAPLEAFDLGPEAGLLAEPSFGSNMAFGKEVFAKYGDFRTDLGPSPNKKVPRPNEDTELGRRLLLPEESGCATNRPPSSSIRFRRVASAGSTSFQ